MGVGIRVAGPADAALFDNVAEDVFDTRPRPDLVEAYLADPRHHIVLALAKGRIVGMCSGFDHFHPDKEPQFFINELGVSPGWRRRGIATRLIGATCDLARSLGCTEAWVVSDPTDEALGFYRSLRVEQTGENLAMFTIRLRN